MLDIQSLRTKTTTGTYSEQSVNFETLFLYVNQLKADGARFITISARDMGDQLQLIYHFELDGKISNLFFMNDKDKPVPSITPPPLPPSRGSRGGRIARTDRRRRRLPACPPPGPSR